jgi:capsular polysaccharide biosynthesis protein
MCASGSCVFEDERDVPESWAATATVPTLRFAAIDPTVHALESQIHYAGHSDVLVGQHGGALGLSLFLPPAHAAVVELQVNGVVGNYHFEHMAYQTGQRYEVVGIKQLVDVDKVWRSVEGHVKALRG